MFKANGIIAVLATRLLAAAAAAAAASGWSDGRSQLVNAVLSWHA